LIAAGIGAIIVDRLRRQPMPSAKQSAIKLLDGLPDDADWDDIMYELYVRQKIEQGQQAAAKGKTIPHQDMRRRLLSDEALVVGTGFLRPAGSARLHRQGFTTLRPAFH
jgi:hypothetical protein